MYEDDIVLCINIKICFLFAEKFNFYPKYLEVFNLTFCYYLALRLIAPLKLFFYRNILHFNELLIEPTK